MKKKKKHKAILQVKRGTVGGASGNNALRSCTVRKAALPRPPLSRGLKPEVLRPPASRFMCLLRFINRHGRHTDALPTSYDTKTLYFSHGTRSRPRGARRREFDPLERQPAQ
ncbi:hypothetical protein E2C01_028680 [Portunus trituberculatus]|uniref:Uncharacterized protein n=1 Tax=Portunus trituberculatus TaxID=210409 RepID=A0A5B7ELA9_PORTR|nr:hypothetical protein [Portunus trituberculatus]